MRASDIARVILIVLVFGILYAVNILAVGIERIKQNWPLYRCNPMIMPIASLFGQDPTTNFTYCIQNMQGVYMGEILAPIEYNLSALSSLGGQITTAISSARAFIANLRGRIAQIIGTVFGVFLNMLIQVQRTIITIKDTFDKISGVMATLLYTISGSVMTTQSMWNGPPGQLVRGLCFHPHTKIRLASGEVLRMCDVDIGAKLKNGSTVCATMKIKNYDGDLKTVNRFYTLPSGENGNHIYVTGCHLVKHPESGEFIPVSEHPEASKTNEATKWFTCFITNDHTIAIGEYIFHDWEDDNGSPSKDLF